MSKTRKESFNDLLQSLKTKKVEAPKPVDIIEERKYFLIVCEGVRTEPIYFKYFRNFLPPRLLDTIQVDGAGCDTIDVVKRAIEEKKKRQKNKLKPPYDEVWAVYDKDDFSDTRYNGAIALAKKEGIQSAHSNQSFELWYVLHFQYLDTAVQRKDYIPILSKNLGFPYTKNSEKIVKTLFECGKIKEAIARAKKLDARYTGNAHAGFCPHTKVHELVTALLKYTRQLYIK